MSPAIYAILVNAEQLEHIKDNFENILAELDNFVNNNNNKDKTENDIATILKNTSQELLKNNKDITKINNVITRYTKELDNIFKHHKVKISELNPNSTHENIIKTINNMHIDIKAYTKAFKSLCSDFYRAESSYQSSQIAMLNTEEDTSYLNRIIANFASFVMLNERKAKEGTFVVKNNNYSN